MLACRRNAWAILSAQRFLPRGALPARREASSLSKDLVQAKGPVANQLKKTKLWDLTKRGAKPKSKAKAKLSPKAEKSRVNIVGEKLCDDILSYIGPSLQRHHGCDLIDIYPGAGLWSRKLHDVLQPRSHILMEPDENFYRPFLEPLLSKSNTTLVPKSGIIWRELNDILDAKYLPHQAEQDPNGKPTRNDTLLVTLNLASFPKRRYRNFQSAAQMVMYQLLSSIRSGSLFQKYGLVRMLVWMNDDTKGMFLPRCVQRRRSTSLMAEFYCDWLMEVVGQDVAASNPALPSPKRLLRDGWIDAESGNAVLDRMAAAGIKMPSGRESEILNHLIELRRKGLPQNDAGAEVANLTPLAVELRTLESQMPERGSPEYKRLSYLRSVSIKNRRETDISAELLAELDAIASQYEQPGADPAQLAQLDAAWNSKVESQIANTRDQIRLARDNRHLFQQSPPALHWDRRTIEPLTVQATEFFPNVECCLLDVQPKAPHPLLRELGPRSSRAGDIFEALVGAMMAQGLDPVSQTLETVWPGASEGVVPACPSLRDRARGGMPGTKYAELSARVLNEAQWTEMLEAWMRWPFRPSYSEMVARMGDDTEGLEPEDGASPATVDSWM